MAQSGARSWGTFANYAALPNVSAVDTLKLLQGDFANVSAVGLYQCEDPTPGSAIWRVIGSVVPSMTTAQRNALPSPPNGMIIYNTDAVPGGQFEFRENGVWVTK